METKLQNRPADGKPLIDQARDCYDVQRRATEDLITHVRLMMQDQSRFSFRDEQREDRRQLSQLESAFELYKQAEAKIQLLLARLGGGS